MIGNVDSIVDGGLEDVSRGGRRSGGGESPRYERALYRVLKRSADIGLSLAALVLLFPVFLVIALVVAWGDGWPVLFRQKRIGQGGEAFFIYKFRTMRRDAEKVLQQVLDSDPALRAEFETTYKLKNDPRLIRFGKFLRASSLDELPQLFNVLKGEMSLVGPRPIVEKEVAMFGERVETYYRMKPGCAGLWQCSGRNDVSYDERIRLNEEYYREAGFRYDFWVMWRTLVSMLSGGGAY